MTCHLPDLSPVKGFWECRRCLPLMPRMKWLIIKLLSQVETFVGFLVDDWQRGATPERYWKIKKEVLYVILCCLYSVPGLCSQACTLCEWAHCGCVFGRVCWLRCPGWACLRCRRRHWCSYGPPYCSQVAAEPTGSSDLTLNWGEKTVLITIFANNEEAWINI